MTMRAASDPAAHDWILHTPYVEPNQYWKLDDHGRATREIAPGRRPSSTQLPVPNPTGDESHWTTPETSVEPHATINEIREHVRAWQEAGWPGVHPRVRRLLQYWAGDEADMRPFWCQRDAVETLIWLFEAGSAHAPDRHAPLVERLAEVNRRWNQGVPRVATKMATGTGKTNVMAMIALWWAVRHPGEQVDVLVLAPGRTIRDRLQVLKCRDSDVWSSIAPSEFERDVKRMRWTIINFQAFQRQPTLEVGGKPATGKEKKLLYGPGKMSEPASWRESESEMLDRLLKNHRAGGRIVVINDEAHHCYTLKNIALDNREADVEEKEDRKRAEVWFSALRTLHDEGRLAQVFDLSATPMWLRRPASLEAETFPWTVSDFSLLDAVESGLVKVPRVPVDDQVADDAGAPIHLHPRYRNIYLYNDKRPISGTLTPQVHEPLRQLYEHYANEVVPIYEQNGRTPVLIVVANTIDNATSLHRYIAGYKDGSTWKPGNLDLFSNVDSATGIPKPDPPTILVHSRLDDSVEGQPASISAAIADQAEVFGLEEMTAPGQQQAIRQRFMSVGRKGEAGESIRCVISVGMLTEGWDARNVTHVFGYRAFGSQLLCEQVAGRALRKIDFTGVDERQPIEYANLFGVPFAWLGGKDRGDPLPPVMAQVVCTVPGREGRRVQFPHVVGYAAGRVRPRWRIDPSKLRGCRVQPRRLGTTTMAGPLGGSVEIPTESEDRRTAVWKAAAQLVPRLQGGGIDHRRRAFLDSLDIVSACLPQMQCDDWTDLQCDGDALEQIARHVERTDRGAVPNAVFADQYEPGRPRTTDTSDVWFRTTLRHWYDAERSELNAAACHSASESELARILDHHRDVAAWVRNFRLDWTVPWFDADNGCWARMEPDFIARAAKPTASGRERYLIIEFKGLKAGEASESAKQKHLEQHWVPAVSRKVDDEDYGDWKAVWIEQIDEAYYQIAEACGAGP